MYTPAHTHTHTSTNTNTVAQGMGKMNKKEDDTDVRSHTYRHTNPHVTETAHDVLRASRTDWLVAGPELVDTVGA